MNALILRLTLGAAAALIVVITAAAVIIFLGGVIYLGLAEKLPQYAAALITAGAALILAIGLFFAAVNVRPRLSGHKAQGPNSEEILSQRIAQLYGAEIVTLVKAHPQLSVVAALLAGVLAGSNPKLRRLLQSLLEPME